MATRVVRTDSKRLPGRSVSLLTPEQLQRKREQDRESQRQTRIRVKQTILELGTRVEMLTQQLHASKHENDTLKAHQRQLSSQPPSVSDVEHNSSPVINIPLHQKLCTPSVTQTPQLAQTSSIVHRSQGMSTDNGTPELQTPRFIPPFSYNKFITPQIPTQVWEARTYLLPATCDIDKAMLDAVEARKAVQALGGNVFEFQSDAFPSMAVLSNPEAYANTHPLTSSIASILLYVLEIPALPQQIAALYLIGLLLRWQVTGTRDDYDAMPEWLRPGAAQIVTPHPVWVDSFPWPRGRDRLCRQLQFCDNADELRHQCFRGMDVNWPYEPNDTLLLLPGINVYVINPVFLSHIRNLDNWSIARDLVDAHPEFAADMASDKGRSA